MKRRLPKVALLLLAAFAASCTPKMHWSVAHPSFKKAPTSNDSIALLGLHDAIVVTRDKWFAKHLEIPRDSVYLIIGSSIENNFKEELQKKIINFTVWPCSLYNALPEESLKLDERIYIKGHFPLQGKPLKINDDKILPYIIIIHEFTFGLDLSREDFFDYALINKESAEQRTSKNLTIILSYTFWDNLKQRSLYSSVAEIQRPIPHGIQKNEISKISKDAADTLLLQIANGLY